MRIDRASGSAGIQNSGKASKGKGKKVSGSVGGDSIKVSDSASLREKAQVMLGEMSSVRLERIEEIRDALENGSFKSDSQKIATQIVKNALAEHPWS